MSVIQKSQQNAPVGVDQLAAIVPLYNEQATVTQLLSLLIAQEVVSQVVIVDDGSTDNSVPLVKEWIDTLEPATAERIQLVQHDRNKGKGRAIRTGLEHVTCSHVIIQDADLEYDPADIKKLWKVMQSGEADVVYGSRYLDNPELQKGRWVMQFGVRFLNLLVRVLYGVKLTDEATCYKMFRTADLRDMRLMCEGFEFCAEVSRFAAQSKLKVTEVPIGYKPRSVTEGKKLRLRDGLNSIFVTLFGRAKLSPRLGLAITLPFGCAALILILAVSRTVFSGHRQVELRELLTVELGPLKAGTQSTHMVKLTNQFNSAFAITHHTASCGCTEVEFPNLEILPSTEFTVSLTIKTPNTPGPISVTVSLFDQQGRAIQMMVTGVAEGTVKFTPPRLLIERGKPFQIRWSSRWFDHLSVRQHDGLVFEEECNQVLTVSPLDGFQESGMSVSA